MYGLEYSADSAVCEHTQHMKPVRRWAVLTPWHRARGTSTSSWLSPTPTHPSGCRMNPGAVSSAKVMAARKSTAEGGDQGEDSLTKVVKKQEAALKRLEAKHGAG